MKELTKKTLMLALVMLVSLAIPLYSHAWTAEVSHTTMIVPDSCCPDFMQWEGSMRCDGSHPERSWHYFLFEATNPTDPESMVTAVGVHVKLKTGEVVGFYITILYVTTKGPDAIKSRYCTDKQFALTGIPSGKFEEVGGWPDRKHFEKVFEGALQKENI